MTVTTVERTGKTVEEAVSLALAEMDITIDMAEVEILEESNKGLFGLFGGKPARVRVTRKSRPEEAALLFLEGLCERMNAKGVACTISNETADTVFLDVVGGNSGLLIGKRGQTLDAIQQLTAMVYMRSGGGHKRIMVDVNSYRAKRIESLEGLALKLADKAKRTGRRVILEPMGAFERRVIHMTLQNDSQIVTYSEGEEPFRKVIISTK
jgi:spoIIIJ-associated protein